MNRDQLLSSLGDAFISSSYTEYESLRLWLERRDETFLIVQGMDGLEGNTITLSDDTPAKRCPLSSENAAKLAELLPWLNPQPLGRERSFGFGDRLGNATPGHVAALRQADPGSSIRPVFAQQSVRENTRLGRSPQEVLDAARWGVLEEGWRGVWGADADHVKHREDAAAFVEAGYSFFTIDPSDHVDNEAQTDEAATLREKVETLPWTPLETSYNDLKTDYLTKPTLIPGAKLEFGEEDLLRALAKYGRALAHTVELSRYLGSSLERFDLEMSVDETDTPTSAKEHYFIAHELLRREVPVLSLAPRFVGKFQKGVDYIGDVGAFERSLAEHAAILRHFGTYKLSIHTGSDKFSLYDLIDRHCEGRVHVKTAGTSYLEALRVLAEREPTLFRDILSLSREAFEKDRKSYTLDARLERVPAEGQLSDAELPGLLEHFDSRQLLHVTFGSVVSTFGPRLMASLEEHRGAYRNALEAHFVKHLRPFADQRG